MRPLVDAERVHRFIRALGREVHAEARVYFVGGASAVLSGWRASTIDIDMKVIPDSEALDAIPKLKESENVNVEFASPDQFIPALPGWEERSRFIVREGSVTFFHFDFYSQALAKLERGLPRDLEDVKQMKQRGLVEPRTALSLFERIQPDLKRYPAIDPPSFRRAVEAAFGTPPK